MIWEVKILDEVVEHFIDYRGKTPNKTTFGVPLVTAKIVKDGRLIEANEFISEDDYPLWMTRGYAEIDDVVLTTEAPLGEVALIKNKNVALAQRIITLRGYKDKLDNKYLKYWLQSDFGQYELESRASGTTVFGIKASVLKKIPIPLPPLPEQQAIAGVLSALDDKIDLLQRQNQTLEQMAATLFRQWFIEEAQEDWEEGYLNQIIKINSGYAFKSKDFIDNGDFKIIKIKNINNKIVDIENTDFVSNDIGNKYFDRFKIVSGSVLIAMTGAEIGKLGIVPYNQYNLIINQRVGLICPKFIGAEYLAYQILASDYGQDYILNAATGSAQPNISAHQIAQAPFPKVLDSALEEYCALIKPYFDKIIHNLGQIKIISDLRNALLPKLISGEVRLKGFAEKVDGLQDAS